MNKNLVYEYGYAIWRIFHNTALGLGFKNYGSNKNYGFYIF